MKTSVVLSAYNGEKYIFEQLESIRTQTVPVNEVLIFDDCSSDETSKICSNFIKIHGLSNWKFVINTSNKGFKRNFLDGFKKATGDIIFIVDQDDKWRANRVENTIIFFEEHPEAYSLCCGFSRFFDNKVLCEHVKVPHRKTNGLKKISLTEFCRFNSYLGMTTAFKKTLLNKGYDEAWATMPYDIAVNFISTLNNGFYYIDKVLVDRRSYPSSTSNMIASRYINQIFVGNRHLYSRFRNINALESFENFIKSHIDYQRYEIDIEQLVLSSRKNYNTLRNGQLLVCICQIFRLRTVDDLKQYINNILSVTKMKKMRLKDRLIAIKHFWNIVQISIENGYSFIKSTEMPRSKHDTIERKQFELIVSIHSLEKGLSFKDKRKGFGEEKATKIIAMLKDYIDNDYPTDCFAVYETIAVLESYFLKKREQGESLPVLEDILSLCKSKIVGDNYCVGGTTLLRFEGFKSDDIQSINHLFSTARSIRNYDAAKHVTESDILHVIEMARMAPSACNRQPVKVYYSLNEKKNKQISNLAPGNNGFNNAIPYFMIVTSSKSYFGLFEYNQWYVTGGIFLGYLRLAFHSHNLGSCIFQWGLRAPEKELRELCQIPYCESIVAIVGFGYYAAETTVIQAQRKSIQEYISKF